MKIVIITLDDAFDTGLSVLLDAFSTANELMVLQSINANLFEITLAGNKETIRTAQGASLSIETIHALSTVHQTDWIILLGLNKKFPETLIDALERNDVKEIISWIQRIQTPQMRFAAACTGTFLLAETGLLDNLSATTNWWLSPVFRNRYPKIQLSLHKMLVPSERCVTAGAAMGHLDLALWLIRQKSPDLANMTARYLVVDERPSQAPYMIPHHLMHNDPLIHKFELWARDHLTYGFSLDKAVSSLAVSKRSLQRHFYKTLGKSPLSFFQDIRVEQAIHLLKTTHLDLDTIANKIGYMDGVTLRSLLRRKTGKNIRDIRMKNLDK